MPQPHVAEGLQDLGFSPSPPPPCSWLIIASTMLTILIVFDPLGGKAAPGAPLGPQPLDSRESNQLLSGLKTAATSVWETRVRLLCCCVGRDDHTRVAFSSTAELFSTYFSVSHWGLLRLLLLLRERFFGADEFSASQAHLPVDRT